MLIGVGQGRVVDPDYLVIVLGNLELVQNQSVGSLRASRRPRDGDEAVRGALHEVPAVEDGNNHHIHK